MKRIALPTGLLLVILLACFVMMRARAQDEPAKPILADDPPVPTLPDQLQPPSPDALDPVSPVDPPIRPSLVDQPQPDALPLPNLPDDGQTPGSNQSTAFDQPHTPAPPTETSFEAVQTALQQIGLNPTTIRDELFCRFKTTYEGREWKFSISAKVPKDSQTVEFYAWLNECPAQAFDAEALKTVAQEINAASFFDDVIRPYEFRFRDHRLTMRRVLNAKDCEDKKRLMGELQTLARNVAEKYRLWSEIGTPTSSQSVDTAATSDAVTPASCQPVELPNSTSPAADRSLSIVDPAPREFFDDSLTATDSTSPSSASDPRTGVKLKIVSLQTLQATDAVNTLQQVFSDNPAIIAADERSNSVILRGQEEDLQELIALLEQLDSAEFPEPKRTLSRRLRSEDEVRLEKQALNLKAQLDEEAARSADRKPADSDARVKDLIQQIRSAVDESFNERQRQQLAEIEELTVRLNKLAKAVRERESKRETIIEERISQLIGNSDEKPSEPSQSKYSPSDGIERRVAGSDHLGSAGPSGMPGLSGGLGGGRVMGTGMNRGMSMGSMSGMGLSGGIGGSSGSSGDSQRVEAENLSSDFNLTELAAKGHSLRKSIMQNMELIPAFQDAKSQYEATPGGPTDALADLIKQNNRRLAIARLALQQDREECSTYLQLLSIEYEAAKAEHERTTQEQDRIRELAKQGVIPTQEVTAAEAAHAKSNAAARRLEVLMKLFTDIERIIESMKTPPGPDDASRLDEPKQGKQQANEDFPDRTQAPSGI